MSVRPSIFSYTKTLKTSGKPGRQCHCLFQWPATSYCHLWSGLSPLIGTDPSNSDTATAVCVGGGCERVRAGACARVNAFARVRAHACACVRPFVRACVRGWVLACVGA